MAKNTYRKNTRVKSPKISRKKKKKDGKNTTASVSPRAKSVFGLVFIFAGLYLILSFISYLFTWKEDQDLVFQFDWSLMKDSSITAANILGKLGAWVSHSFFYDFIGIASFLFGIFAIQVGINLLSRQRIFNLLRLIFIYAVVAILLSLLLAYFMPENKFPWDGAFGRFTNQWLQAFIGKLGAGLFYLFLLLAGILFYFNLDITGFFKSKRSNASTAESKEFIDIKQATDTDELQSKEGLTLIKKEIQEEIPVEENTTISTSLKKKQPKNTALKDEDLALEVEVAKTEEPASRELTHEFDPTLELSNYKFPSIQLLEAHGEGNIDIDRDELERNKDQIIETLRNYKIEISKIKATVGPTVTLYEIVPAPGVRISKIKNLEDDIALSLAALGIRIIAPIPGKGTIGIEVPNKHKNVVSMRSMLTSEKYVNSKADLPVAIGKTVANENYIADLARMPHLLIAGATGQGKSVGINALLVSLLYKKHPSELKFVLIDPKKVELSIYSRIEKHYLAKLPGEEEPIITDTTKVVNTLNSLCIEMDDRYDLLKSAECRNIKEYNRKFKARKLNPEKGHRFLPYIVLVIDELADLIMTAGKEVESPIARLAQLARAIGIHLIIATQRPSVNIITGIIKANFPARIAFRVMSKIDSRTILDMGGADQLIGRGDLILSIGSDSVRLQCPFVDTPEVDAITDHISDQQSFGTAFILPEFDAEGGGGLEEGEELDDMFADAARMVVQNNSGSTSMLQRRLKLGYNRAGRIMDQLERAGIVGPSNGSKPRDVLYMDEIELEQYLKSLV